MAEGQGEGEAAPEEEKKKGGAKKLIIKIVPLILIALVIAKMTVLKPPPPTAAQVKAKAEAAKLALDTKCALANDQTPPKAPAVKDPKAKSTTPTTVAAPIGPVLELDSKTMNLDGTHFLKIGISLQLPAASVPDDVKIKENWGSIASQLAIDTFSGRSFAELSSDSLRRQLQHEIGNEVCRRTEGKVVTVYFIDFVMQ
ncbi:MAG TPA: flagellar basal body-associated FliL family protein [Acidimicrobiia bacterium]|nr:flagellar basal body-associated FliL family protein [Acidimicrobiia bacterium]